MFGTHRDPHDTPFAAQCRAEDAAVAVRIRQFRADLCELMDKYADTESKLDDYSAGIGGYDELITRLVDDILPDAALFYANKGEG